MYNIIYNNSPLGIASYQKIRRGMCSLEKRNPTVCILLNNLSDAANLTYENVQTHRLSLFSLLSLSTKCVIDIEYFYSILSDEANLTYKNASTGRFYTRLGSTIILRHIMYQLTQERAMLCCNRCMTVIIPFFFFSHIYMIYMPVQECQTSFRVLNSGLVPYSLSFMKWVEMISLLTFLTSPRRNKKSIYR